MKVEYLRGLGDIRFLASSTRVLSNNLMRDDRFDVRFNPASFTMDAHTVKYILDHMKKTNIPSLVKASTELWFIPARLIITTQKFIDKIIDTIQHDIVLYSAHVGIYDYYPIRRLLERGFRVVVGGPTAIITEPEVLRNRLGVSNKLLENLIIVRGYVDLNTDLYSIIQKWKDTVILNNNFNTIWNCYDDPFQQYFSITKRLLRGYPGSNFIGDSVLNVVVFRNFCHWGRCSFCHYPFMAKNDYISETKPEKIADNIIQTCKLYETNNVFLSDGCFIFNDHVEKILDILVKNAIKISMLIRIPFLKNVDVLTKINKYISMLDIGIESFNNFTLKYINKGYQQDDIFSAFNAIKKHLNRDIRLNPYLIMDLPYNSKEGVMENYNLAVDLQIDMKKHGFSFKYTPNLLEITWDTQGRLIDNNYIRHAIGKSQGRHIAFDFMKHIGLIDDCEYLAIPFERYDRHGRVLKSDLYQIPEAYTDIFCHKYGV